ncbi:xylose ABC transporter ATP-binding protein [Gracilibacillus kekensis]|uniref:D-xylose transport system ATP-binding protein n=1 Tax=Gracilibacillus kekensis TaxID=1027249 RepID=A0A1M7IQH6_9BACI|nr:xylose ABC transporter ATP-binding protein [Gracilibacillus kekensis]SHM43064.1 D-xylose transport system ATP-binding protein [Gracilibacillus kekensis]
MSYALQMNSITKEFPGVKALDNVSFSVKKGEIHALCGENGAGKSTLMKVLSGLFPTSDYQGVIEVDEKVRHFESIKDAEEAGIAIIYQELAMVKHMTVAENLILGKEPSTFGFIQKNEMFKETNKWLAEVGLKGISPETVTGSLGIGQQQLIEIAKALSKNAHILILDEPTAALTETEVKILLNILREFRKRGVTCIYISHKIEEVFSIADQITILRDGQTVATKPVEELTEDKVISLMVGRELKERFPKIETQAGKMVLEVSNYTIWDPIIPTKKVLDDISFHVRAGEILGIAGLMGSGRTELVMSLFGSYAGVNQGEVRINGRKATIQTPQQAIKHGMALVSEDRKRYGLILGMDIKNNVTMASLDAVSKMKFLDGNKEIYFGNTYLDSLRIKAPSVETLVGQLSGGNQQKVVLGKWLMTKPKLLILDEPTRGIDVGAKFEIYNIINQLVKEGVAIIMISSELPEVIGMSHRIMVISEGCKAAEFDADEVTQEKIMTAATGGTLV